MPRDPQQRALTRYLLMLTLKLGPDGRLSWKHCAIYTLGVLLGMFIMVGHHYFVLFTGWEETWHSQQVDLFNWIRASSVVVGLIAGGAAHFAMLDHLSRNRLWRAIGSAPVDLDKVVIPQYLRLQYAVALAFALPLFVFQMGMVAWLSEPEMLAITLPSAAVTTLLSLFFWITLFGFAGAHLEVHRAEHPRRNAPDHPYSCTGHRRYSCPLPWPSDCTTTRGCCRTQA